MLDGIQKKFQQILANMDPETLQKGFKTIQEIMNTEEGKKLSEQLKNIDKEKLMNQINQIDEKRIEDKLEQIDTNIIAEKMDKLDTEKIIRELTSSHDLIKKLKEFMNNEH